MKKIMTITAALVFAITSLAFADGIKCSSANDAEEYWSHGERIIGMDCVQTIIEKDPGNTKAHFLKGKFQLETGNYAAARNKFAAGDVRARYGDDIFQLYKSLADKNAANGNISVAGDLYEEALAYKPAARQAIANELFEAGKKSSNIRGYFTVVIRLDASMAQKTAQYWNGLSQKATSEEKKIEMLHEAAKDDPATFKKVHLDTAEAAGRRELAKAKEYAKKIGQEKATEKYKALARHFFKGTPDEGIVDRELPEVVKYTPRAEMYVFRLGAGEQTNHWIELEGNNQKYAFLSDTKCTYDQLYADGYVAKKGQVAGPEHGRRFKFRAISDCMQTDGGVGFKSE